MGFPSFEVEMYEGRPGSGKSFVMLERVLQAIEKDRRPVFTNLPLRWRVVRQYLRKRGGEDIANLIFPLTEDHFRKFIERAHERLVFKNGIEAEAAASRSLVSQKAIGDRFVAEHGPDVYSGDDANWIPNGSLIVIDEVHHWFPQTTRQKSEPGSLMQYVTMHRHHMHSIIIATQNRMQVSLTLRRQVAAYWHVRNKGDDKFAFGLRWRNLGVRGFAYAKFTPEQEDAHPWDDASLPSTTRVIWPWLPKYRWRFRLYNSFQHGGSVRLARREMERARESAGLLADGMIRLSDEKAKEEQMKLRLRWPNRLRVAGVGCLGVLAGGMFTTCGAAVGYTAGRVRGPEPVEVAASSDVEWPHVLNGISRNGALINGKRVGVMERVSGVGVLLAVDRASRSVFLGRGDDVWLWVLGEGRPSRLGGRNEVMAAIREAASVAGYRVGSPIPGSAE